MTNLKDMFKLICEKSMVRKRHILLTEETLKENPNIAAYNMPSLDARQNLLANQIPKLAKEASLKALQEWGRPKSEITHLIFCSGASVQMPGPDYHLVNLLNLSLSVNRIMLYHQGFQAGGTVLRIAKDLAENNKHGRILVVCVELMATSTFRGPSETHLDLLNGHALFGDGACAMIIGVNRNTSIERPILYLVFASQTILPNSADKIQGFLGENGLILYLKENVPKLIAESIQGCLENAFGSIGVDVDDWNSIFWASHPGLPAILDEIELRLKLSKEKMRASRSVVSEYGNMAGATVLFILDEIRKTSFKKKQHTTGEGLEWGVLFGYGSGLTVETMVLRSATT